MGTTTNYSWTYPTVNADADAWGTILNNMAIAIDASLFTVDGKTSAAALKANNLSDLASASTARTNLGLGSSSTLPSQGSDVQVPTVTAAFTSGHFCYFTATGGIGDSNTGPSSFPLVSNNLSDLASASTARTNLGLGSISTHNVTISSSAPSGGSDGDIWFQYA